MTTPSASPAAETRPSGMKGPESPPDSNKQRGSQLFTHVGILWLLTAVMLVVALGAMLVISSVYRQTASDMFSQLGMSRILQAISDVGTDLDTSLQTMRKTMDYVESGISQEQFDGASFAVQMRGVVELGDSIAGIELFTPQGTLVMGMPHSSLKPTARVLGSEWFERALAADLGETVFSSPHVQNLFEGTNKQVVSISRRVVYREAGDIKLGILVLDLWLHPIAVMCQKSLPGSSGYLSIVNARGEQIYHPEKRLGNTISLPGTNVDDPTAGGTVETRTEPLLPNTLNSKNQLVLSHPITMADWNLVALVTEREIAENTESFNRRMLGTLVIVTAFVFLVALVLSYIVIKPLLRMQETMHRVDSGMEDIRLAETGLKEYAGLSHSFNIMLERIRTLMQETMFRQEQLRLRELNALQEQINPHFLYNTLDSIIRMLEAKRNTDAVSMIESLARLFRLSLNKGSPTLTVAQEIEHVGHYLNIQKVRYRNRFAVAMSVEDSVRDLRCPKLILQPLAENAIRHGIGESSGGRIVIRASGDGDRIVITVWDNGNGFTPDRLKEIRLMLAKDDPLPEEESGGIGLHNINRRLHLLYGPPYGLDIQSEPEEFTCITITFPAKDTEQAEHAPGTSA